MSTKTMSVTALAVLTLASAAGAQNTGAFFLGGHVGRTMGSEVTVKSVDDVPDGTKFETESGMGYGVIAGFAFPNPFSIYGIFAQANQDAKNSTDDINLRHLGVGLRYDFGPQSPNLHPYIAGEFGQRAGIGEDCSGGGCTDFSFTGLYFGGGVGGLYYFRPDFAFDGSVNVSVGGFTELETAGENFNLKTDSPMNIRIHLGVTWFPTRKPR